MNRKQLITLIVLGVVIGGLGLFLFNRKSGSWKSADQDMRQTIIKDFPLNDVTHVRIKQAEAELNLVKNGQQWTVQERWNYPANFGEIGDLLRKIWELKSVQTLKVGPSQFARLELLPPDQGANSGTLLEFIDKDGRPMHSLLLGKKATRESPQASPFGGGDLPVGRFIAFPQNPENVWLVSESLSDAEARPDRWLNKDFFKVEKLRSIAVLHPETDKSWKLAREKEGGDLDLAGKQEGEEFDKNKAFSAGHALSYPSFNDVAEPAKELENPILATIETFDGFAYNVQIAPKSDDAYLLRMSVNASFNKEREPGADETPEDKEKLDREFQDKVKKLEEKLSQEKNYQQWTYVVSKWTVDPLLKERKDYLADPKTADQESDDGPGMTFQGSDFPPMPPLPEPLPVQQQFSEAYWALGINHFLASEGTWRRQWLSSQ
jgi:hypothetical protein